MCHLPACIDSFMIKLLAYIRYDTMVNVKAIASLIKLPGLPSLLTYGTITKLPVLPHSPCLVTYGTITPNN